MFVQNFQFALLRAVDATADALGWLDRSFDPDDLISAARRQTGLHDFGEESFRQPLDQLLLACAEEASLSVVGRAALRWDVCRFLANLLHLEQAEAGNHAIQAKQIRRPVFITGLPRSGTTFLHKLMMLDAENQVPRVWETIYPYPTHASQNVDPQARIRKVDRQLRSFERLAPEFPSLHPIHATSPQECSEITAHLFASLRFDTTYRIPSYRHWLDRNGHVEAYRFHKRFLQHLHHRSNGGYWVLKCPDHVFALDALRAVYPDARLVFVHRDPVKVLPSVAHLTDVLRRPFTRHIDPMEIGRQESERWLQGVRHMIQAAKAVPADPGVPPVIHVQYSDLVANPLAAVEDLYARLDRTLPGQAADAIRTTTTAEPNGGYGANRYVPQEYGLNLAEESEKFAFYTQYFGIKSESRSKPTGSLG